jgi:hypothetical protein
MNAMSVSDTPAMALVSVEGELGPRRLAGLDRTSVINRILDWSDEARAKGRNDRAQYLTCLAWSAYDGVLA